MSEFTPTEEANLIGYGEGYCAGYADGLRERVKDFETIYAACLTGDVFAIPTLMLEMLRRYGMSGGFVAQLERLAQRQVAENDNELIQLRRQYADMCDRVQRAEEALIPFAAAYQALMLHMAGAAAATLYAGFSSADLFTMPTDADGSSFLNGAHLKTAHDLLVKEGVMVKAVAE